MANKHNLLLRELYNLSKDEKIEVSKLSSLEYMYETALLNEGRYEYDEASSIYSSVLLSLQNFTATEDCIRLRAKCLTRLGSIKRDQGKVAGINGAFVLYQQALSLWKSLNEDQKTAQIHWYLGACNEMQKRYDQALIYYKKALDINSDDNSLRGAILLRVGTVVTKLNDPDMALKILNKGMALVEYSTDQSYYAYGKQKIAIAEAEKGNIDKALYIVSDSLTHIPKTHKFRVVQTKTLLVDLMFRSGEMSAALEAAKEVEELANQHNFGHQLTSLKSIIKKHSSE